ncbi:AraC family transcriptional regulator [Roseovarius sp. 217]|uniref:AraC family transcriptional regulator n=1 Tax=Roseovarius sp. (strain 217) TaxID=314264 RepID=UPI0000684D77|nr:AraC family transcriptional regulator [Roseovarius sp. 217]EAQ25573.1 transcriptional regulatory protein [Roseovarius sp. 217]
MTMPAYSSFAQWYKQGPRAPDVQVMKSSGGILNMIEATQPAKKMYDPAVPDLVLHQDLFGGSHISANLGGGHFDVTTKRGGFVLAAPNFANYSRVDTSHHIRSFAFPLAQWQSVLDEVADGKFSFGGLDIYSKAYTTPAIQSALRNLWSICEEEGPPSRLLARAAGCEILAGLCRLGGASIAPTKGGLAPWAKRRCIELMHMRLSEDISLDELAAEVHLSPFHFARMFKQSLGVPPRVYLTQLRMEKTCELLEQTDLSVTEIALEVGYSSNQVLARVFLKKRHMSPSEYRRSVRAPVRSFGLGSDVSTFGTDQ